MNRNTRVSSHTQFRTEHTK